MARKQNLQVLLALLLLAVSTLAGGATPLSQTIYDEKADARAQISAALRDASRTKKNIVFIFGANW